MVKEPATKSLMSVDKARVMAAPAALRVMPISSLRPMLSNLMSFILAFLLPRDRLLTKLNCGKAYKFFSLAGIMGLGIDLLFFKFFAKVLVFVLAVME